jgi:SPP1 family holin
MDKLDKGTVIRTVLLFIALINQTLIMMGKPVIPIEEDQVTSLVEGIYLVGSLVLTIVTSLMAWWRNNYISDKGQKQKEVLKVHDLTKK